MLIRGIVAFLVGIVIFVVVGWFTGSKAYGAKDDERSAYIKQQAMVGSWTFMLIVFATNSMFDLFNLRRDPFINIPFDQPALVYLIILVGSYFIYYLIYSRRLSIHEK